MSAAVASDCERCEVEIATTQGVWRVEAVRCGAWAVHPAGRTFALTHLPTGTRVPAHCGRFRDEASAVAALREVAALEYDWPHLGVRHFTHIAEVRRDIIAVCLRHGGADAKAEPSDMLPHAGDDVVPSLNGYGGAP
ncbi:MAG: hypothetical protein EPO23_03400 [Xanthobacteraceae bacterium]|nr:MAG: hypothetical protein EPO23_03400 [Xanthobacteraceae bacterium]